MKGKHDYDKFQRELIKSSESNIYLKAEREWTLNGYSKGDTNCICGVKIKNQFRIRNINNNNILIVGSICIKKFMICNVRLITDLDRTIYNIKCQHLNKLYRKCDTCNKRYNIYDLSEHDWKKECKNCFIDKQIRKDRENTKTTKTKIKRYKRECICKICKEYFMLDPDRNGNTNNETICYHCILQPFPR